MGQIAFNSAYFSGIRAFLQRARVALKRAWRALKRAWRAAKDAFSEAFCFPGSEVQFIFAPYGPAEYERTLDCQLIFIPLL